MQHLTDRIAALAATGDLPALERFNASAHALVCAACRARVADYKQDTHRVRSAVDGFELPRSIKWNELEGEMYANIRLGMDVSEIRDFGRDLVVDQPDTTISWRAAVAVGAMVAIVMTGWFLAGPRTNPYLRMVYTEASIAQVRSGNAILKGDKTGIGVESRGAGFMLRSVASQPARVEVGLEGSVRSSAVDEDSGQVTVSQIYVE